MIANFDLSESRFQKTSKQVFQEYEKICVDLGSKLGQKKVDPEVWGTDLLVMSSYFFKHVFV